MQNRQTHLNSFSLQTKQSTIIIEQDFNLTVGLSNPLELVLLLNSVAVSGVAAGVDEFISKALGDGAGAPEGSLPAALGEEAEGLVDSPHWGNIASLTTDGTANTNTGGIFASAAVLDSLDEDNDWVLTGGKVDEVEGLLDDPDGHDLLAGVTAVHHEVVNEPLDEWAVNLVESLVLISAGGVWDHNLLLLVDGNVVNESAIELVEINIAVSPLSKKLDVLHV